MKRTILSVGETLQTAYNEQYTDETTAWRECGGKYKADNILNVCKGHRFSKVLECGAGEGSILKFLDEANVFSELFAIEISDSGISQIQKRNLQSLTEVKKFDGYEIPFSNKAFDMVYCSHVIEHVEHPRILLREIKRVSDFQAFEIPLDYSLEIDKRVDNFLSYGHINIYTPSLFKFLLKSEGYEIISERFTHIAEEVIRFNWDKNLNQKTSFIKEIKLKTHSLRDTLKRALSGKRRFEEYGYSAYTCLAKGVGDLRIF
jgi:ubiquinone/menaquinone biosynthesis C-methylase UbiE